MIVVDCQYGYACHQQDKQLFVYVVKKVRQLFSEHRVIRLLCALDGGCLLDV